MSPRSIQSSSQSPTQTKFKTLKIFIKNTMLSFPSPSFLRHRHALLISLTLFLIYIITRPPLAFLPSTNSAISNECKSGKIYVYELPTMFNRDLLVDCDDLDPWHWQCGIATNHGYGRRATELAGIMPENLSPAWYRTNQFSLEVIFHNRIMNHTCRTTEPESATAFYIPFYAGLAVGKYLFANHTAEERDFLCERMLTWLQAQPYWRRSNGSDHFMALGRITWDFRRLTDPEKIWGSSFLNMPAVRTMTRLTIERAPSDYYDIGVPYPTGFHPHTDSQILHWQNFVRTRKRTRLTSFVGATRGDMKNDFRGVLLSQCKSESDSCRLVDCAVTRCSNGSSAILEALLDSEFCLQPRGDSYTRRSVFDCMIAGSIPVFFWKRTAYDQYEWFLPGEPGSFSVFIDYNDVLNGRSIRRVLGGYSRKQVEMMRDKVIECIPKIVYAMPNEGLRSKKDAFDIAIDGVLRRFKENRHR